MSIYDDLFSSAAMRAIFSTEQSLQYMLDVEAALARAQARLGIIPQAAATAISGVATIDRFDIPALAASTRNVGYPVIALTKALSAAAGVEASGFVHLGATTQDILDTALVLQMRAAFALIEADLITICRALATKAQEHRSDVMAGRTHLQHAVPVTFGYKCAIWLSPLLDHLEAMRRERERVLLVQFGGAAGTLASLGQQGRSVTDGLARELSLGVPDIPWHVTRAPLSTIASSLGILCGSLGKFATDVMLLMQTEVGEVSEPHEAGRGGSSTMPQKRNPIASEYIIACARNAHALVPLMLGAMIGDHERSTGPWQSEFIAMPQLFMCTGGALMHALTIATGMTVDTNRMRRNLDLSGGLIGAEAFSAALTLALGRERAHHFIAEACNRALSEGRPLIDILENDPAGGDIFKREVLEPLLDPRNYLGDAPALVDRVVARARRVCGA